MARSARRREPEIGFAGRLAGGVALSLATLARNPVLVGGSTAFMVTMFYVSANAIWYQPGSHRDAVFVTRPFLAEPVHGEAPAEAPVPETLIRIEREEAEPAPERPATADPVMMDVQKELSRLGLYGGAVDGLSGPQTRQAISTYQKRIGLPVTGNLNDHLVTELLGRAPARPAAPTAAPREAADEPVHTASVTEGGGGSIAQVQAGLRAFGNDHLEIDGRMGPATAAAIREFQTLFGLPVTGAVDQTLVDKMREVGLTN